MKHLRSCNITGIWLEQSRKKKEGMAKADVAHEYVGCRNAKWKDMVADQGRGWKLSLKKLIGSMSWKPCHMTRWEED